MTETDMPEPMTPAGSDLSSFPYMPLHWPRLRDSDTWILASAHEKLAAFNLWCQAWYQVPAGSLPNNESLLQRHSDAGDQWPAVRDHALRGWVLCSDGRLYHPFICGLALTALASQGKRQQQAVNAANARWRRAPASAAKDAHALPEHSAGATVSDAGAMPEHMPQQCRSNARAMLTDTDTETDTEKSSPPTLPSGANPLATTNGAMTVAAEGSEIVKDTQRLMIEAFDRAIKTVYGEDKGRPWPYTTDRQTATQWVSAGVTVEDVWEVSMRVMSERLQDDNDPMSSLSGIGRSMKDHLAAKKRGARLGGVVDHSEVKMRETSQRETYLRGFVETGIWPARGGPKPTVDAAKAELSALEVR